MSRMGTVFPSGDGGVPPASDVTLGASNFLYWSGRSRIGAPTNGGLRFQTNNGGSGVTLDWASGVLQVLDNTSSGYFGFLASNYQLSSALTAGTMGYPLQAFVRRNVNKFTWTNANVVALGAALTGNIAVCTLPAKTVVINAYVIITGAATGPSTLTVSVGRTAAAYIDYIVASDAKAAANTVYGDASAERGTNLTGYDLASFTGTTVVNAQFVATVANLDQTLASTGSIYLETMTFPG